VNDRNRHSNISYDHAILPKRTLAYGMNEYILLLFLPLVPWRVADSGLEYPSGYCTTFNYLALIPLSALIVASSFKLSQGFGGHVGSLIDTACANTMELIVRFGNHCISSDYEC
jgi:Ca2+/H+ antiporter